MSISHAANFGGHGGPGMGGQGYGGGPGMGGHGYGGGHGMGGWKDPSMQHWRADMIAWLRKTLK